MSKPTRRTLRALRAAIETLEPRQLFSAYTVINNADSGAGSLRQAIINSNANGGADTIDFAIPGAGVHTIAAANGLPLIAVPMLIDGYTQPGAVANTNGPQQGSNAQLMIEVSCSNGGCIAIAGGNSTLRGLVINGRTGTKPTLRTTFWPSSLSVNSTNLAASPVGSPFV